MSPIALLDLEDLGVIDADAIASRYLAAAEAHIKACGSHKDCPFPLSYMVPLRATDGAFQAAVDAGAGDVVAELEMLRDRIDAAAARIRDYRNGTYSDAGSAAEVLRQVERDLEAPDPAS